MKNVEDHQRHRSKSNKKLNVTQQTISDLFKESERSQDLENGCHINWTTEELLIKFCFKGTIENQCYFGLLLAMEHRFSIIILNRKKSWVNLFQPSSSTAKRDQFGWETICLVEPEKCGVLLHSKT